MPQLTQADRDVLVDYTKGLRQEEKAFMESADFENLQQRLTQNPDLLMEAHRAFTAISEEIGERGVRETMKSYEVALEIQVARERLLLEIHRTDSVNDALEATRLRLNGDALLEAAWAAAQSAPEITDEDDDAQPMTM